LGYGKLLAVSDIKQAVVHCLDDLKIQEGEIAFYIYCCYI